MGLLKHLRSRSRFDEKQEVGHVQHQPTAANHGHNFLNTLPEDLIREILVQVCPHTLDTGYLPSEQSTIGDGCMLCDLRDLGRAAQVCRRWYTVAQKLLYRSVRIDAVHYCELEDVLAQKRKRKSFLKSTIEAGEIPSIRLGLFCRTVRESPTLATQVQLLKLPYISRETCKTDLARTISALPNLQYVDLPDGVSTGDPSCYTLLHELQSRCPDIRRFSYRTGAEASFELLAKRHWHNLEILEISGLAVEPSTFRIVLAALPTLHQLTVSDLTWMDDSIFHSAPGLPPFPSLQSLALENVPNVTAAGLQDHLSHPQNREILSALSLNGTGVAVTELHSFLPKATNLLSLAINEMVTRSIALQLDTMQPMSSLSLQVLHFEIADSEEAHGLQKPAASYYTYLARCLHANALPALREVYVRDTDFPELLILPPPGLFSDHSGAGLVPSRGFNQTLEVFSKGLDELEWVFTAISPPPAPGRNSVATGGRPLSAYSASRGLGPQWTAGGINGEARKSVVVGNGFGGFLAVPADEMPRPMSAGSNKSFDGGRSHSDSIGSLSPSLKSLTTQEKEKQTSRLSFLKPVTSLTGSVGSNGSNKANRASRHDLWR